MPISDHTIIKRFWKKVDRKGENECWPWIGHLDHDGYGHVQYRNVVMHASKLTYLLLVGPVAQGLCVCHSCDNPSCCNPKHLWLGTRKDNSQDMARKGRTGGGRNQFTGQFVRVGTTAKLSHMEVSVMKLLACYYKIPDIARAYDLKYHYVWDTVKRSYPNVMAWNSSGELYRQAKELVCSK